MIGGELKDQILLTRASHVEYRREHQQDRNCHPDRDGEASSCYAAIRRACDDGEMVEEGEKEEDENPSCVKVVVESCDPEGDLELKRTKREGKTRSVKSKRAAEVGER